MKKIMSLMVLVVFVFVGCVTTTPPMRNQTASSSSATTTRVVKEVKKKAVDIDPDDVLKVRELQGYYLKNSIELPQTNNIYVISSENELLDLLGKSPSKAASSNIDFDNNVLVLIAVKPSTTKYDINISNAYLDKRNLHIDYEITPRADVYHFALSMKLFSVSKHELANKINLSDASGKTTSVSLDKKDRNATKTIDDIKKNYTGTYRGTLPGADNSGIVTVLRLNPDFTFTMQQVYMDHSNESYDYKGQWTLTEDLSSFILTFDSGRNDRTMFYFVNKNTIEQLDKNGKRINSENYILRK